MFEKNTLSPHNIFVLLFLKNKFVDSPLTCIIKSRYVRFIYQKQNKKTLNQNLNLILTLIKE